MVGGSLAVVGWGVSGGEAIAGFVASEAHDGAAGFRGTEELVEADGVRMGLEGAMIG